MIKYEYTVVIVVDLVLKNKHLSILFSKRCDSFIFYCDLLMDENSVFNVMNGKCLIWEQSTMNWYVWIV